MSIIGNIQKTKTNGITELIGSISTLRLNIDFRLSKNTSKSNDNEPSFKIITKTPHGTDIQIGSVWEKSKNSTGDVFLSMTFDDPSFDHSLNVAAFKNDPERWDIVWRRRQGQQSASDTGQ